MRIALSLGLAALFLAAGIAGAADDKPKYTTKEVMKLAHGAKEKLLHKVTEGKASDEEKKKLLELYEEMGKNKPKPGKGDAETWKKMNDAIITAAKGVVEGKEGSAEALKKATKCGDCHQVFK